MANKRIGGMSFSIVADTSKLTRQLGLARMQIAGVSKSAKLLAGAAMAGVAAGATATAAALVKMTHSAEQLNRSMTRSLAIMGNVSEKLRGEMRQAAIDVAKTTNFSASQAADAYYYLASAGLDAQQSLAAMPKVAKFATAGNFDLALATDLLTDAQSALGLTVKESAQNMVNMTRVSDVLVKANTLANASVEQFSKSLTTKAGAAMRMLGMDVEEGVAVLAAYADQGLKAEEAGTAFSIVLRDMQTKALQNASAFQKNRIAVFDASGEFRNMADIISDVEKRLYGMSDAQKKATLLSLGFSDKSVAYTQTLIGTSDKIRGYEEALRAAGGTTAEVAEKSLTPMEKSLNKLKGAFQQLAESMTPWIDKLAKGTKLAAELVEGVNSLGVGGAIRLDSLQGRYNPTTPAQPQSAIAQYAQQPRTAAEMLAFQLKTGDFGRMAADYQDALLNRGLGGTPPGRSTSMFSRAAGGVRSGASSIGSLLGVGGNLLGRYQEAAGSAQASKERAGSAIAGVLKGALEKIGQGASAVTGGVNAARFKFANFQAMAPALAAQMGAFNQQPANRSTNSLALASAGSVEGHRQRVAAMRQTDNVQKQSLKVQKDSEGHLKKIANALAKSTMLIPTNLGAS